MDTSEAIADPPAPVAIHGFPNRDGPRFSMLLEAASEAQDATRNSIQGAPHTFRSFFKSPVADVKPGVNPALDNAALPFSKQPSANTPNEESGRASFTQSLGVPGDKRRAFTAPAAPEDTLGSVMQVGGLPPSQFSFQPQLAPTFRFSPANSTAAAQPSSYATWGTPVQVTLPSNPPASRVSSSFAGQGDFANRRVRATTSPWETSTQGVRDTTVPRQPAYIKPMNLPGSALAFNKQVTAPALSRLEAPLILPQGAPGPARLSTGSSVSESPALSPAPSLTALAHDFAQLPHPSLLQRSPYAMVLSDNAAPSFSSQRPSMQAPHIQPQPAFARRISDSNINSLAGRSPYAASPTRPSQASPVPRMMHVAGGAKVGKFKQCVSCHSTKYISYS
jgi:hypothetical protein